MTQGRRLLFWPRSKNTQRVRSSLDKKKQRFSKRWTVSNLLKSTLLASSVTLLLLLLLVLEDVASDETNYYYYYLTSHNNNNIAMMIAPNNNNSSIATINNTRCKYHGNCPVGTVCDGEDGICLPYYYYNNNVKNNNYADNNNTDEQQQQQQQQQERLSSCVKACFEELVIDERFYYGGVVSPVMVQSQQAASAFLWNNNGHGCILTYERRMIIPKQSSSPGRKKTIRPIISVEEWMQGRFRRVVRVDKGRNKNEWVALCDDPCQTDGDCPTGMFCVGRRTTESSSLAAAAPPPGIASAPKSCRRRRRRQQKPSASKNDMVIVSGADSQYFRALENFAASVEYWAPKHKLVVYNLGMSTNQLAQVQSWPNLHALHWKGGIPKTYPPHVHDLHTYAWKSIIINETVHLYHSIFWLDSGATLTGPVAPIEEIIQLHGIFLVKGQDDHMRHMSHPASYRWFGYNKSTYSTGPHFAGGIQGHVYPSRYIDTIVIPNAKCALDPTCIAPSGSHLSNHRYDQTSLSILAYQRNIQAPAYTELLAAGRDQLSPDLSQPSRMIIWTARGSCHYYAEMKLNRGV